MLIPRASTTSAEPHLELMLRLPCLATRTPAPAVTSAVAVEMLKVPLASPPVPLVSTRDSSARASRPVPLTAIAPVELTRSIGNGAAASRIASAKPTISSTVSPFIRKAMSRAAICASLHLPFSTSDITSRASARASDWLWLAMRWRASRIIMTTNESRQSQAELYGMAPLRSDWSALLLLLIRAHRAVQPLREIFAPTFRQRRGVNGLVQQILIVFVTNKEPVHF